MYIYIYIYLYTYINTWRICDYISLKVFHISVHFLQELPSQVDGQLIDSKNVKDVIQQLLELSEQVSSNVEGATSQANQVGVSPKTGQYHNKEWSDT